MTVSSGMIVAFPRRRRDGFPLQGGADHPVPYEIHSDGAGDRGQVGKWSLTQGGNALGASFQPSRGLEQRPITAEHELKRMPVLGLDQNDGGADVGRIGAAAFSSNGNRGGPGELSEIRSGSRYSLQGGAALAVVDLRPVAFPAEAFGGAGGPGSWLGVDDMEFGVN